jgi:3-hydroxybutyrate dehydrogenase
VVENKVVFITGAARGIGFEIGKTFAEQGARVVITDLDKDGAEKAAKTLREAGCTALGLKCNVTEEQELKRALEQAYDQYGSIDVLINNAGLQHVAPLEDFPKEKFELLLSVMLTAPFTATKQVFPIMKKQKYGRIINMASINGLVGFAGKVAYNSAKHGVIGLTKVAALEGAEHGITVNAVCPGYVDTPLVRNQLADLAAARQVPLERVLEDVIYPLVPQKRLLSTEEVAQYVLFLAGKHAKSITGQACVIDGGYTAQ